jgi:hypothetical protein
MVSQIDLQYKSVVLARSRITRFSLPDARLADSQNSAADLRLVSSRQGLCENCFCATIDLASNCWSAGMAGMSPAKCVG